MARSRKAQVQINNTFVSDKAYIVETFGNVTMFDYAKAAEILNAYKGEAARFLEIKLACIAAAILVYASRHAKAMGAHAIDAPRAAIVAAFDGNLKENAGKKLTTFEADARKSGRNKWFGFTSSCGIITQEKRGGARPNASRPSVNTPKVSDKPAASPAPVVIEAVTAERQPSFAALKSKYATVKAYLIKLQAANAKDGYNGDEGARLLKLHTLIIDTLNSIGN